MPNKLPPTGHTKTRKRWGLMKVIFIGVTVLNSSVSMKPSLSRSNILKASLTIVHENPHLTPCMTPYTAPTSSLPPGHPVHSWPSSGSGTQGTRLYRSGPGLPPSSGRAPEVAKRDRSLFCSRDIFIFLILFQYRNDSLNLLF